MSSSPLTRTRRAATAGIVFLFAGVLWACDGSSVVDLENNAFEPTTAPSDSTGTPGDDPSGIPGDTTGIPGDTTGIPGDTTGLPGDTTGIPGDTTGIPGDTTGIPGDTTGIPGDSTGIPGDTVGVPGDTIPGDTTNNPGPQSATLIVQIGAEAQDTAAVVGVANVVFSVTHGNSPNVVARDSTTATGWVALTLQPGQYTVKLDLIPPGYHLAPGEPQSKDAVLTPGNQFIVNWRLERD